MVAVHIAVGAALTVLNLLAFVVGGIAWYREQPSIRFWYLLRAAQVAVFLQAALGALLVVFGYHQHDSLHYLYGILPLVVSFLAEGARTGAAERELRGLDVEALPEKAQEGVALAIVRREMGIMTVSCGVIFFLALRAAGTSGLF